MNKADQPDEKRPDLTPYITAVTNRFAPTDSDNDATHKLSTREVADAINELNPSLHASAEDVFNALYDAGFVFRSPRGTSSLQFKWLMIEK